MVVDRSMTGAPVYDCDGHQIGTVKDIEGSAFKVDVPLAFDYWLHFDAVHSARLERVELCVDRDHLDEFKLNSPDDIPHRTRGDDSNSHDVEVGSESYGAHDGTMVGAVVTGMHPNDRVIVRGATTVEGEVLRNDDIAVTGVTDWGDVSDEFREDWQSEHQSVGTWEEMEPGYHFGYEMAHDPRFHGRSFDSIEPDMRTEWISWSRRSGSMSDESSWDRVRASVRRAFDSAHGHRRAA